MNSRALVLVIFAVWCAICWRWYVCGIKKACDRKTTEETAQIIQTPAIEPDTAPLPAEAVEPTVSAKNGTGKESAIASKSATGAQHTASDKNAAGKTFSPSSIDRVQMESVKGYMVIHFPYNSVRREDNDAIDNYLSQLASELISSGKKVRITGHTDFVGEPADNVQFGLKRANSIRDVLIKKGVKKSQIICKSLGDKKPIATNDTAQGRYKNRRVEISVGK